MRYFTRGWASGELTDEETDRARDAYWAHVAQITPRLPPDMARLLREVRLHDSIIERVEWNPVAKKLVLVLVASSVVQDDCISVRLSYGGAMLGESRVTSLRRAALSRETEVLYDEVDVDDEGVLMHRFLFSPCEEVTIDFRDFAMEVSPRAHHFVALMPAFLEVEPEED